MPGPKFGSNYCLLHHSASADVPYSILVPGLSQVNIIHTPSLPDDVKENMIHQTRPPSSIASLFS